MGGTPARPSPIAETEPGRAAGHFLDDRPREDGRQTTEMRVRYILLWLLGVPIPILILIWLFFGH